MRGSDACRIRCIRAANPSALTGSGTNTWIVGQGRVAIIDPGPALPAHHEAILAALDPGESISHILVTHAHKDHSALARALALRSGAPVLAFGGAEAGRSAVMRHLVAQGLERDGEGADHDFAPDLTLTDGAVIAGEDWSLRALHTPGHMGGHLCFALEDVLFSGDHVMGWSSTIVSPPDGDMAAYMASLEKLAQTGWRRLLPGHGEAITSPGARLAELAAHRRQRASSIETALQAGPATADQIARQVYTDIAPALLPAASRNVLAHLIELTQQNRAKHGTPLHRDALFAKA